VQKSVSIIFNDREVENWGAYPNGTVHLEDTLWDTFANLSKPVAKFNGGKKSPCKHTLCDHAHFSSDKKPWKIGPPATSFSDSNMLQSHYHYFWYQLSLINDDLSMGLNFSDWPTYPHLSLKYNFNRALRLMNAQAGKKEGLTPST
jgi:hypothetical protein